jgi:Spy/CpxP family protein refolding chaperone
MRNNSVLKFALIASLILNFTVLATAGYLYYRQTSYWVSPFGMKMPKDRFLFDELSLRPEQRKAMREKAIPFRAEIDRRRQEIVKKRKELFTLMREENPDRKAIGAVIAGISGMQEEMQRRIAGHMLEEKALLDRDQQQKFLDLIESRMTQGVQAGCPPVEQTQ